MSDLQQGGIAILDFGSQYTQLIARRIRELGVYAEVFAHNSPPQRINQHYPLAYVLSGGPNSVYESDAPQVPQHILDTGKPILGICYGLQALTHIQEGTVAESQTREYGLATIQPLELTPLLANIDFPTPVWMSHGDRIDSLPANFVALAHSDNSPYAVIGDEARNIYGVQFHPEVTHTKQGKQVLQNFVQNIAGCEPKWKAEAFITTTIKTIQEQVGDQKVLLGLSGGVDSAVAGTLLHRAIGDQLVCVFVDTGMLRHNEAADVVRVFQEEQGMRLVAVNATELFLDALENVTEPESKRKLIGKLFIDVFAEEARKLDDIQFLAQGTIYPDVIESAVDSKTAKIIKSHHNVGGLPDDLQFDLIEPLRDLFKDEVRQVGTTLGLPDSIVWRQPFPGPGLAIRCLGNITWERLETLRAADVIFLEELRKAGLLRDDTAQSFAVLLPVQTVGVMGDQRTYEEVIALRAVTTDDFMTADWARLPYDLLSHVSRRIVNEVPKVNRVVYDITSKPPGTIEWE